MCVCFVKRTCISCREKATVDRHNIGPRLQLSATPATLHFSALNHHHSRTLNIQVLLHSIQTINLPSPQGGKSHLRAVISVAKVSQQCADMQEPHVS